MEFSRQEYWNELPFHTLGNLHHPGIEPESPVSPTLAGEFFTTVPPGKPKEHAKLFPRKCFQKARREIFKNFMIALRYIFHLDL